MELFNHLPRIIIIIIYLKAFSYVQIVRIRWEFEKNRATYAK